MGRKTKTERKREEKEKSKKKAKASRDDKGRSEKRYKRAGPKERVSKRERPLFSRLSEDFIKTL